MANPYLSLHTTEESKKKQLLSNGDLGNTPDDDSRAAIGEGWKQYGTLDESSSTPMIASRTSKKGIARYIPAWFKAEFLEVFHLAWSMILLSLFSYLIGPVSIAFCGHLGTVYLDGVALAGTVINVTGISIGAGLSTACDTCFAQSYGSVNKKQVGIYLIRGSLIILLFVFPCWAIHLNAELLLIQLGQDADVAKIAGDYILYFMPALPAVFLEEILMQYLRCQNILYPTVVVGAVASAVNALMHYLLLYVFEYGFVGSVISQVVTFYLMAVMLLAYILARKIYKETWGGWTMDIFQDWGFFCQLAVSGLLMVGLEWWSNEVGTLLAGVIGPLQLAAQSICFQLASITYMLPLGVGLACNIRVGQLLGAGDSQQAERSAKVGVGIILVAALCMAVIIAALSPVLPMVFSSDDEVIEYASDVILLVAVFMFFDSVAGTNAGILRGCGRQMLGAGVILLGYYAIGLPVAISLMFLTDLEVLGFFIGMTCGVVIESTIFLFLVFKTDWKAEAVKAGKRAGVENMTDAEKVILAEGDHKTEKLFSSQESLIIEDDGEDAPLVRSRRRRRSSTISYHHSPYTSSSQVNLVEARLYESKKLNGKELLCRRGTFVLLMMMVFFIGLVLRFEIEIRTEMTHLCIPFNSTQQPNATSNLPNCTISKTI